MGFNPIGLRAAVEMCGVDRVVFGSDYGPIPYGIKTVQIVKLRSRARLSANWCSGRQATEYSAWA